MRYLGYNASATTIRHILEANGIVPDPERRLRGDWSQFIETQQYVTASTDFAQVERLTPFGLVRESLLFFMDIGSREVCLGGIVHNPDSDWTTQIARNMCDMWDGFMLGKKYLIHDLLHDIKARQLANGIFLRLLQRNQCLYFHLGIAEIRRRTVPW